MYPEAPTCSIRSLSFISIFSFLSVMDSQTGSRVIVWSSEISRLAPAQEQEGKGRIGFAEFGGRR